MIQLKIIYKFFLGLFYFIKFRIIDSKKIKEANTVFFLPYYHTGGAEKVHLDIVKALINQKCCIIFTHLSATNNFYEGFQKYAQIVELNDIINKKSLFFNKALEKSLLKSINNSKTVCSVFGSNTKYYYKLLPNINNTLKRVDLVHALGDNDDTIAYLAESSTFIDTRVSINAKAKNDIIGVYKKYKLDLKLKENLIVIQNGVDVSDALRFNIQQRQSIVFGFVGRWSEEKRPELFLEIARQVKTKYSDVEFVMAGTGMKSNLNQINEAGVAFLGEITNKETLDQLYNSLTGIVITSVYEGFPMAIMESMIFGVIPFTTNVGGINDHINHLDNGVLVDSRSDVEIIEDFIKYITFFIENKKESLRIAKSAKSYSVSNFSIEKFNESYKDLFKL